MEGWGRKRGWRWKNGWRWWEDSKWRGAKRWRQLELGTSKISHVVFIFINGYGSFLITNRFSSFRPDS